MRQAFARVFSCTLALALLLIGFFPNTVQAAETPPAVDAEAYVLMDASTGQVLVEKNAHLTSYPASITKILTLALALEHIDYPAGLDTQIEVTPSAINALIPGASHVALTPGEVVSVRDVLYAAHIESGNDASNVLAEFTAGSLEAFAEMMNQKAAELGLSSSNFVNANGLPNPNHVTTAHDMGIITSWALSVPGFRDIFYATNYNMPPTNKQANGRVFNSSNLMLIGGSTKYYNGITGSKSGYTDDALYTLATSARRGDIELVCIVLKCPHNDQKYTSTSALLDYGFENFTRASFPSSGISECNLPVYGGSDEALGEITICGGEDISFLLHNSLGLDDVVVEYNLPEKYVVGQSFAPTATLALKGETSVQQAQLISAPLSWRGLESVMASNTSNLLERAAKENPVLFWIITAGVSVLVFLFAGRILYVRHRRNKRRAARLAAARAQLPIRVADRPRPPQRRTTASPRPQASPAQNRRRPAAANLRVVSRPQYTGTYAGGSRRAGSNR